MEQWSGGGMLAGSWIVALARGSWIGGDHGRIVPRAGLEWWGRLGWAWDRT